MKYDIQTVGFEADQELYNFLDEQLDELKKYFDNITGIDVYLKSVKDDEDETKIAEIKLFVPGPSLYAEHRAETMRESIIEVVDKLRRQLEKLKEKQYSKR
ncbi:MAG: ribosome-associated translation inhibitor RaiA [Fulvivirga sp.]|nr:ribosome-associated translation inhibitor RaiA [Fulvivirga sp.]